LNPLSDQEVSTLLQDWSNGDQAALEKLTPIVYGELHRLARHYMRGERTEITLQTTALVNEAYLKLVDFKRMRFKDRAHFFAVSAQLMRRILVDHARKKNLKRGGGVQHLPLDESGTDRLGNDQFGGDRLGNEGFSADRFSALAPERHADLIQLDNALVALAGFDPRKARVVELRFFGGLSVEETAEVLEISAITVMRDWNTARAWLYRQLSGPSAEPAKP
jgi:RNA polymerase sigma factor (sigma-70 family)